MRMVPTPGNGRRRGGRKDDGVRKGPWTAEEDEVLMEYVRSNGPRDWSTIRSRGLLPRTGKSCRLRWVNKLKPDLKTGCKFSAEEERIVIDLQAQLGNKWARIATHLPGRTDNDVKNFWSTRQKRLARILRAPLPSRSARPRHSDITSSFDCCTDLTTVEGSCSNTSGMPAASGPQEHARGGFQMIRPPFLSPPQPPDLSLFDGECSSSNALPSPQLLPTDGGHHLLCAFLDLPPLTAVPDLGDGGFVDLASLDDLVYQETVTDGRDAALPFFGVEASQHSICSRVGDPDIIFEDLPLDMFDNLDPPPQQSVPSKLPPPPPQ